MLKTILTKGLFINLLASVGFLLFLCSIGFLNYTKNYFPFISKVATYHKDIKVGAYDIEFDSSGPTGPSSGESETCNLDWKIKPYQNTMLEGQDQALEVDVHNPCKTFMLKIQVTLDAKDFNPTQPDRVFNLYPGKRKTIGWVLEASKTGQSFIGIINFDIIEVNVMARERYYISKMDYNTFVANLSVSVKNLETFKISVNSPLGLNSQLLQLLSQLGVFLGSAITLPWWYEQWQKRKESKEAKTSSVTVSSPSKNKETVSQKAKSTKNRH